MSIVKNHSLESKDISYIISLVCRLYRAMLGLKSKYEKEILSVEENLLYESVVSTNESAKKKYNELIIESCGDILKFILVIALVDVNESNMPIEIDKLLILSFCHNIIDSCMEILKCSCISDKI